MLTGMNKPKNWRENRGGNEYVMKMEGNLRGNEYAKMLGGGTKW